MILRITLAKGDDMKKRKCRVRGELFFTGGEDDISGALVVVRICDISRMDAPSAVVLESRLPPLCNGADTSVKIPFEFHIVYRGDKKTRYSIEAHADIDRDGEISGGDYITTANFIVDPVCENTFYYVELKKI